MKPAPARPRREAINHDRLVHEWRLAWLTGLGKRWPPARTGADQADRNPVAALVRHGCPPRLGLRIAG